MPNMVCYLPFKKRKKIIIIAFAPSVRFKVVTGLKKH